MPNKFIQNLAAIIAVFFSKNPPKKNPQELEFKHSTQKIGLRFTDKIRESFRSRWLKTRK